MDKILDFIEKHKYGILITIVVHVALFVYFQLATYKEAILFEPWNFTTANDEVQDDIAITPDQIETPEERQLFNPQEKVTSFVKDQNDSRTRSLKENVNYTSSFQKSSAEQMENDYEQSLKDEIRRKREERNARKAETSAGEQKVDKKNEDKKNDHKSSGSSSEAVGGKTMVSFSLINRHPLNHNDWYVRNPGYTCGNVNGTVTVSISVDVGGVVTSATVIDEQSQNASACMLQRAREYALKSRFNYAGDAPKKQEGTITYRFVYRE
ncbi:hypothetical protein [Brumimicrobium oceani]|uniref:TonB C-terminal domain-containing protein n=1 Tax=Brumimicrobium oceani TaxID=2100725 RepID=A0A2U2XG83_9FLAO|nr:hypothetical protein [Brumimicrobium oceani]PWH86819.1 hypothetical protein DIT68_00725 [Brumimicrobium oceani]